MRGRYLRPAQVLVAAYLVTVMLGTCALMLPIASTGAPHWPEGAGFPQHIPSFGPSLGGAPFSLALFTATSATSVTGLILVDTATYWSNWGQAVLMVLFELGGLGTMTVAALVGIAIIRRFTPQSRELASASTGTVNPGDVRAVIVYIARFSFITQACGAVLIAGRLLSTGSQWSQALWNGTFLSVSAYNNAGFAPYTNSLMGFSSDPWIILPIAALIILGGLGFPVLVVLSKKGLHWRTWDMNTRLVIVGSFVLIVAGWVLIALFEWNNPRTLGAMNTPEKLLNSFFSSVSPRTAGFNSLDTAAMGEETWVITDLLMFVGGGPASTAGGIKVTTALVLFYIVVTEVRGDRAVNILGKRLDRSVHRQVVAVIMLASTAVLLSTLIVMANAHTNLDRALFEVTSAFSTVGLSTGITPDLPFLSQVVLIINMMVGRVGPLTVATAFALRRRRILYELPKDRPLIG